MKIVRMVAVVALVYLGGCNPTPSPAMTGTWVFTLSPTNSFSTVQATANLTQQASAVSGSVSLAGNSGTCSTTATMSGAVSGQNLTFIITQSQSTIVTLSGTANTAFTSASGNYTTTAGCLQGAGTGTWTAVLQ